MTESNPLVFDDCIELIEKSIAGLEITSEFVKLPQIDKVIGFQKELRDIIGRGFKSLIIRELFEKEYAPFSVTFWDSETWEVSLKKVEKINPNIKRKWWQFVPKNKKQ